MDFVHYHVQSPWTNNAKGREYPLLEVTIQEMTGDVVTKTGLIGIGIVAYIRTMDDKHQHQGTAVYAPEPGHDYDFLFGAKLALKRALEDSHITREYRTNIWTGFFAQIPV